MSRSVLRNEQGFTLLEVMVASALGLIVFLGISQLMVFQTKAGRSIASAVDFSTMVGNAKQVLSNAESCGYNIGPNLPSGLPNVSNPQPITIPSIYVKSQTNPSALPIVILAPTPPGSVPPNGIIINGMTLTFEKMQPSQSILKSYVAKFHIDA